VENGIANKATFELQCQNRGLQCLKVFMCKLMAGIRRHCLMEMANMPSRETLARRSRVKFINYSQLIT